MGKSYKLLGGFEDRLNRDCAERTIKIQLIPELEAGIPYFQMMIMDSEGLIAKAMEIVFH